jgi:hypothetical protein
MQITILNRTLDIDILEPALPTEHDWGMIDPKINKIHINKNLPASLKEETLIHECIHSIAHQLNLDINEELTDRLTCGIYSILNDNDWSEIKEGLKN